LLRHLLNALGLKKIKDVFREPRKSALFVV
jgi:hypothetical protein